jgi:flagellar biosynthesis/type III secretory pathway M-ring protein FliF/YscJ
MKSFADILKQFTSSQRVIVLFLLLFFSTIPVVVVQWMKTDDCKPLIDENLRMQQDFAKISTILREERMKSLKTFVLDTALTETTNILVEETDPNLAIDKVIEISDSHLNN